MPFHCIYTGASIPPEAMMHFPPIQISPLFPKKISASYVENFSNFTFSQINFWFSSTKISYDPFLVIPLSLYFEKITISPLLFNISLL